VASMSCSGRNLLHSSYQDGAQSLLPVAGNLQEDSVNLIQFPPRVVNSLPKECEASGPVDLSHGISLELVL
jgi:hypothetical protein